MVPEVRTVTTGDRTFFTCRVKQATPPISIKWRHENHTELPNGVRDAHDVLYFDNVQTEHNGTYSCNVTNSWGSVVIFATLLVEGEEPFVLCMCDEYVSVLVRTTTILI